MSPPYVSQQPNQRSSAIHRGLKGAPDFREHIRARWFTAQYADTALFGEFVYVEAVILQGGQNFYIGIGVAKDYTVIASTKPDLKKTHCVGELLFGFPEIRDVVGDRIPFVVDAEFYCSADVSVHLALVYAPMTFWMGLLLAV